MSTRENASPPGPRTHAAAAPTGPQGTWLPYVLPLAVFMVVGMVEPLPPGPDTPPGIIPYALYPGVYAVKLTATILACAWSLWFWTGEFPIRFRRSSLLVGAAGTLLWVGVCHLRIEPALLKAVGWESLGARAAYNPFEQLGRDSLAAYGFFALRLLGLAVVVPVVEEFFLRGFLMRYVMHPNWWAVPFGTVNAAAIATGTLFPMLTHPGEFLAAALWFSGMTWWMMRTRNIWDCVLAHGVTNLLLGVYVVWSGQWHLL